MKKLLFSSLLMCLVAFCQLNAQSFQYLSPFNNLGVPSVKLFETVPATLKNNVTSSLPESKPVPTFNPSYIANGVTTDVKLIGNAGDSANVWITFVTEGAGYKNVLGFYTYNLNTPPTTAPTNANIKIIFPNVSFYNSGGGLYTGDKIALGRFPVNTGIGFVLLANGFTSSGTVTAGQWRLFSNPNFNPESSAALRNHIVLLNDTIHNKLIFGFEDIRRDYSNCDQDFNDAVFYVTANPMSAISKAGTNYATQSPLNPPVTSGNTGGLESNGSLAEIISYRNYKKTLNPEAFNKQHSALRTTSSLKDYFPALQNRYTMTDVTPVDLLAVTNAKEIAAIDYFEGTNRVASVFSTLTNTAIYDHSKVICDRLNGAELLSVETITFYNVPFILYHFKNTEGNYEYAMSFSVANDAGENRVYSRWVTEQYPVKATYENFQVWGNDRSICEEMVLELLGNIEKTKPLVFDDAAQSYVPTSFISKGYYVNGKLVLTIINKEVTDEIKMSGLLRKSETLTQGAWSKTLATNQQIFIETEVEIEHLYDLGLTIKNSDTTASDILYLADGAWGLDYEKNANTTVTNFEVVPQTVVTTTDFVIERGIKLDATTKDYVSAFKLLKVGGKSVDLSAFNALEFDANGLSGDIQITLVKESVKNFSEQYRTTLLLDPATSHYILPFSEFSNNTQNKLSAKDITNIILTSTAKGETKTIRWDFENFAFTKNGKDVYLDKSLSFNMLPNPCKENVTIYFESKIEGDIRVSVSNTFGQVISNQSKSVIKGMNKLVLSTNELSNGIFLITLTDDKTFLESAKLYHVE